MRERLREAKLLIVCRELKHVQGESRLRGRASGCEAGHRAARQGIGDQVFAGITILLKLSTFNSRPGLQSEPWQGLEWWLELRVRVMVSARVVRVTGLEPVSALVRVRMRAMHLQPGALSRAHLKGHQI